MYTTLNVVHLPLSPFLPFHPNIKTVSKTLLIPNRTELLFAVITPIPFSISHVQKEGQEAGAVLHRAREHVLQCSFRGNDLSRLFQETENRRRLRGTGLIRQTLVPLFVSIAIGYMLFV